MSRFTPFLVAVLLVSIPAGLVGAQDEKPSLKETLDGLESGDREVRRSAMREIALVWRDQAVSAAPRLVELLDSPRDRFDALAAIGAIGPDVGESAVDAVIAVLHARSGRSDRRRAIVSLSEIGGLRAANGLARFLMLDADSEPTRWMPGDLKTMAARELATSPSFSADDCTSIRQTLANATARGEPWASYTAAALKKAGAKDELLDLVRSDSPDVAAIAAGNLGWLITEPGDLLPLLSDERPHVRESAGTILLRRGLHDEPALVDAVSSRLEPNENIAVKRTLMRVVLLNHPQFVDRSAVVRRLLDDDDDEVRGTAMQVVARIGATLAETQRMRSELLDADNPIPVRESAAKALGYCRNATPTAVRALENTARDPAAPAWVRAAAIRALGRLVGTEAPNAHPSAAIEICRSLVESDHPYLSSASLDSLVLMGSLAAPAIPWVVDLLKDDGSGRVLRAVDVLGVIGSEAAPCLDAIRAARDLEIAGIREACDRAIKRIESDRR